MDGWAKEGWAVYRAGQGAGGRISIMCGRRWDRGRGDGRWHGGRWCDREGAGRQVEPKLCTLLVHNLYRGLCS